MSVVGKFRYSVVDYYLRNCHTKKGLLMTSCTGLANTGAGRFYYCTGQRYDGYLKMQSNQI